MRYQVSMLWNIFFLRHWHPGQISQYVWGFSDLFNVCEKVRSLPANIKRSCKGSQGVNNWAYLSGAPGTNKNVLKKIETCWQPVWQAAHGRFIWLSQTKLLSQHDYVDVTSLLKDPPAPYLFFKLFEIVGFLKAFVCCQRYLVEFWTTKKLKINSFFSKK